MGKPDLHSPDFPHGSIVSTRSVFHAGLCAKRLEALHDAVVVDYGGMNISMMETGQTLKLKVFRNGQTQELSAMTAALPGTKVANNQGNHSNENSGLDGVSVESLDAETAQQSGLSPNTKGVVVTGVDPASAAAAAGLKQGDVIQEVNHSKIANMNDLSSAFTKSYGESLLLVNRNGNKLYLAV